ncbi:efflux RND transporter periplasmic adaptor subunit [Gilvimarinus sp. SDUM040013]|uniref:Efflux RND transporter periplasmic adaptor subunit n=2 Tax=Gilvimarinus gilvus TaxID=3058038 RepID=A0ABU4RW81_9GAMM|nr:efflux RND transporter periplasmic adaptor subunit [Gilvimarinus sp. SDUM040013]MDX6849130.1 efflux RND transporter periplasmic adaptor subunit [Gilvimarinus sp. SDUM040013]
MISNLFPRLSVAALFCCAVLLIDFSQAEENHEGHDHDHSQASSNSATNNVHVESRLGAPRDEHDEAYIKLTRAQLSEFDVEFDVVSAGVIRQQTVLPGQIRMNTENIAHISPRFPAKILDVSARIGDTVKSGQVLAKAESSETLARFEIKSLIDGQVIERHITLGEHLMPSDNAFVVANMSSVWLDIALYPAYWGSVRKNQIVSVGFPNGEEVVEGNIDYVAPTINELTHTGIARVFLNNQSGRWKPGMFVEATVTLKTEPADVVVPLSAVFELEGGNVVFTQSGEFWQAQLVELGRRDDSRVEIIHGLEVGEAYVRKGGFILKAHLQKSEFESGHNH